MISLLDVNVLVALAWPNHIHHRPARVWFDNNSSTGWATCPLTQSAFVRISSNRKVIPDAKTPQEALRVLRHIVNLPDHTFWIDDISIATTPHLKTSWLLGHKQVTDAHLLALALRNDGRLATFDRGVSQLIPKASLKECVVTLKPDPL